MIKLILLKTIFIDLEVITLLCMTCWTLLRSSKSSGTRKTQSIKCKIYINVCWFSMHAFSCFVIYMMQLLKQLAPQWKLTPQAHKRETPVRFTHTMAEPVSKQGYPIIFFCVIYNKKKIAISLDIKFNFHNEVTF